MAKKVGASGVSTTSQGNNYVQPSGGNNLAYKDYTSNGEDGFRKGTVSLSKDMQDALDMVSEREDYDMMSMATAEDKAKYTPELWKLKTLGYNVDNIQVQDTVKSPNAYDWISMDSVMDDMDKFYGVSIKPTPTSVSTTTTPTQTNQQVGNGTNVNSTASAVNASANGSATNVGAANDTPNAGATTGQQTDSSEQSLKKSAKTYKEQGAEELERWRTLVKEGLSVYKELVGESLRRREELAERKERNARSVALANALGSLVNVLTAGAMASRNDTIPVVSQYNKEPDTDLRRAIEGRYAIGNENEGILMNLAKERYQQEKEIAGAGYKHGMNALEKDLTTDTAIYQAKMKRLEKAEDRDFRSEEKRKDRELKKQLANENNKARKEAARIKKGNGGNGKKYQPTPEENRWVTAIAQGRTATTQHEDHMGKTTTRTGEVAIKEYEKQALVAVRQELVSRGLTKAQLEKAIPLFRKKWQTDPADAISDTSIDEIANIVKK